MSKKKHQKKQAREHHAETIPPLLPKDYVRIGHALRAAPHHGETELLASVYKRDSQLALAVQRAYAGEIANPRHPWTQMPVYMLKGGAATFARAAQEAGHDVAARSAGGAVQVGVHRRDGAGTLMRATWVDGVSVGATFDGVARNVTVAKLRLTMTLAEADAAFAAESARRVAKAKASRAAADAAYR